MSAGTPPIDAPAGLGSPEWGGFDRSRARADRPKDGWRAFRTAARLGWQMEANWTDPFLFFIYSVAKPISAALILVVMLDIISGGTDPAYRAFVVVGTALWAIVLSGIAGLAWTILDDRERYRMLKYVYVSPSEFLVVLLGRGIPRLAVGVVGGLITIGVGILLLGVPFDLATIDWPLLVVSMVLGIGAIIAIGVFMAAVCLQSRQEAWSYPEALAGALFLVSGAVFPLAVLPMPLQAVGLATPLAWWIEGVRRAAFPGGVSSIGGEGSLWLRWTGTAAPDGTTIVLALLATGLVVTLAATGVFRVSERRAKERGLLDRTTGS
jgi:ABC-2 type transport system permease protein